jgi:hypothetical protein
MRGSTYFLIKIKIILQNQQKNKKICIKTYTLIFNKKGQYSNMPELKDTAKHLLSKTQL